MTPDAQLPVESFFPADAQLPVESFFPETCHPPLLTRRRLLMGAGALAAAAALAPVPAGAGDDGASIIRQWGSSPDDPWAVCHGVRGIGRDFSLKDGRRAVDWLLETQLAAKVVNGKEWLAFPVEVEIHPNSFLKTMLEANVPQDHAFTHQKRRRTFREVVEGAHALFRPAAVITSRTCCRGASSHSRGRPRRCGASGRTRGASMSTSISSSSALSSSSRTLRRRWRRLMREDKPETAKAPVHDFTCGGTHMIYGVLSAVQAGYAGRDRLERIRQQMDILVWRLRADMGLIDRFYKERAAQPGAAWFELDAKLKLLGHGQECVALAVQRGLVKLSDAQRDRARGAEVELRRMIDDMGKQNLAEAKDINRELLRQLVGDTCHARHGLAMGRA